MGLRSYLLEFKSFKKKLVLKFPLIFTSLILLLLQISDRVLDSLFKLSKLIEEPIISIEEVLESNLKYAKDIKLFL